MKIAHLVSTFPPYQGGMGNAAYQMCRELALRGHDISVFTPNYAFDQDEVEEMKLGNGGARITVNRVKPAMKYGNAAYLPGLSEKAADVDVVHLHYPFLGAESILASKKPMVMLYQMDLIGSGWKSFVFDGYQNFYLPQFIDRSAKVIFTTKDYMENSRAAKLKERFKDKMVILPLGVGDEFKPAAHEAGFWPAKGVRAKKIMLFVAGLDRAHYFKGVPNLLKAFAAIKDDELALVIVGDGDLKQKYIDEAKSLRLTNVHFMGRASKEELIKYYQQSDFFVLPSVDSSEAYGLVLLESLASARPVIASSLPGVRALVDDGRDGYLVKPGDVEDLSAKIKKMISSDFRMMGQAGSSKIESSFRWPNIIKQLESVYNSAIKPQ